MTLINIIDGVTTFDKPQQPKSILDHAVSAIKQMKWEREFERHFEGEKMRVRRVHYQADVVPDLETIVIRTRDEMNRNQVLAYFGWYEENVLGYLRS